LSGHRQLRFQRSPKVLAFADVFHQVAISQALVVRSITLIALRMSRSIGPLRDVFLHDQDPKRRHLHLVNLSLRASRSCKSDRSRCRLCNPSAVGADRPRRRCPWNTHRPSTARLRKFESRRAPSSLGSGAATPKEVVQYSSVPGSRYSGRHPGSSWTTQRPCNGAGSFLGLLAT
jgi:hypothetical protein